MLSGLKFIPRDKIEVKGLDEDTDGCRKERKKSRTRKEIDRRKKKKGSHYSSSSDDEDFGRIKSGFEKKKKWYASDDGLSSYSDRSGSESESDHNEKKGRSGKRKEKRRRKDRLEDEGVGSTIKKKKSRRKDSDDDDDYSSNDYGNEDSDNESHRKKGKRRWKKDKRGELEDDDDGGGSESQNLRDISRKEMGLDWMLRPKDTMEKTPGTALDNQQEVQVEAEEIKKENPRELNPYLKDNGSGYPEDSDANARRNQLFSSSLVGDGGASWRLKALKRAQEQAAREGRKLQEVVEDRWGSLGELAVSAASHRVAPNHAHLHAIKSRRRGLKDEGQTDTDGDKGIFTEKDGSSRHTKMRVPKVQDSLSWGKRKMPAQDINLSAAVNSLNKFSNDGSFMCDFMQKNNDSLNDPVSSSNTKNDRLVESNLVERHGEDGPTVKPALTANQLAAKVMQLRMKGKHEEAQKLLEEAESTKVKPDAEEESHRPRIDGSTSRYIMHDVSARQKMKEEDADLHLAQKIMRNQQYKVSGQADDEYDYEDGPRKKTRHKGRGTDQKSNEISQATRIANRLLTQKERCQFCFENPARPKHLVVAIANFTYLSLPHRQPVVPGHCCIVTMQHESSTRTVDNNVWDEIRNFKKCLIMMFAKQDKEVVFLETVMGLAQQRRHCLLECIPLPQEVAKQAPLYFKKAIDEAEEEWSQHNAKKLIDTSQKGLRASIPKNFPYFHVEFGLDKGFVHVIDDEKQFKSNFGFNVIRGMLRLPAEDMHRRQKHESLEMQKQAVAGFARDWEPFDWTKQFD
ncbi:CWF19-like protein 2 [Coffea eugenioides]|uniref:CWF19-like protein 2 n=1 Tax=Coffea eugenioides TaxID=49369 RepID=UPI000F60F860|nr:CWF19-like protein 2 [Coffea eugenioides]